MAQKAFSGRVYALRGVWHNGKARAAGEVFTCPKDEFVLLAESRRCVEFDEKDEVHVEALKKSQAAAKKAEKEAAAGKDEK